MSNYQMKFHQVVNYPRCRIYRQFVQSLINDRNIRICGGSGLFYYTVLCSYANFRTSYRRIDGFSYTVYPGEWICTVKELTSWFRSRFQWQAISILEDLQKKHLISFISLNRGKVIKYQIHGWSQDNTVLDYNCPCQKDTGFFFLPIKTANLLVSSEHCSEMDIMLDLWISTVYNDEQVEGSTVGPVVYLRNGTGIPLVSYHDLAQRWGISKATVGRVLKKLDKMGHITLMTFSGRTGSVIYLQNYLSTMFQISDVIIDKVKVAMVLNINISLPTDGIPAEDAEPIEHEVTVSKDISSVSKKHIEIILREMAKALKTQWISCFYCPKSTYKLLPLSNDCWELVLPRELEEKAIRFKLQICCGSSRVLYTFALTLFPADDSNTWRF